MADPIKKTGHAVKFTDSMSVKRVGDTSTFTLHLIGNENHGLGIDRVLTFDELKQLNEKIKKMVAYSCPKCGAATYSYRRSELDWNIDTCPKCGWREGE